MRRFALVAVGLGAIGATGLVVAVATEAPSVHAARPFKHGAPQEGPDPKIVARGRQQYAAEVERHMASDWAGLPAEAVTKRQASLKYTLVTEPALKAMGPAHAEMSTGGHDDARIRRRPDAPGATP